MSAFPAASGLATAVLLLALVVVCAAGYLRGRFARRPKVGSRPASPHAGFATPEDLARTLSEAAVRRAGHQVRPSLTHPPQGDTPP
ncbi:hypothetical protein [Streptomyces marincola]|uniref:hypothetical protein n=1 Tax=Streptomyces marincola TaxID=2878388 RepID=UPI001CF10879|nr:hypothetical protein [Streptomyces marincola]UCM87995.1 hypothetical protein LC193_08510 [Streptomyces marincola]